MGLAQSDVLEIAATRAARVIELMTPLSEWENFYVMVGSAAGALIGLQFVVMTLVANRLPNGAPEALSAFGTPTIVHFEFVLLLSAVLCAPWHEIGTIAFVWGLMGLGGIVYAVVVARRMRVQTTYQPVLEDWLFHLLLPFASYAMLAASACAAQYYARPALFVVGAATLLLLYVGIHNSWDSVTYHVSVKVAEQREAEQHR
jgi:hypothetical protein